MRLEKDMLTKFKVIQELYKQNWPEFKFNNVIKNLPAIHSVLEQAEKDFLAATSHTGIGHVLRLAAAIARFSKKL